MAFWLSLSCVQHKCFMCLYDFLISYFLVTFSKNNKNVHRIITYTCVDDVLSRFPFHDRSPSFIVGLTTWLFHPIYSSKLFCNANIIVHIRKSKLELSNNICWTSSSNHFFCSPYGQLLIFWHLRHLSCFKYNINKNEAKYHHCYSSIGHCRNINFPNLRMNTGELIALETQFDLTVELLPW